MNKQKPEETIDICVTCEYPAEIVEHNDIMETSYGGGQLVSEYVTWRGTMCCGSDIVEWHLSAWIDELPLKAFELEYITKEQYEEIIKEE